MGSQNIRHKTQNTRHLPRPAPSTREETVSRKEQKKRPDPLVSQLRIQMSSGKARKEHAVLDAQTPVVAQHGIHQPRSDALAAMLLVYKQVRNPRRIGTAWDTLNHADKLIA